MDTTPTVLIRALELQAAICVQMGSPFSGMVARAIAADMAAGGAFAALAEPWAGHDVRALLEDATPLRFMGGMHYLALTGAAPELAAEYPPAKAEPDEARLALLIAEAGRTHQDTLARFLTSPPQTNEVNRSVCLVGGFLTVVRRTGLPLRCLELGASAGLNLNWDRYRYELGEAGAWGDPASPVHLTAEWNGGPPPFDTPASVVERRGCDQAPIDVAAEDQALRLKSYFWPDQSERIARLDGAITLARRYPPEVERADAAVWARSHARGARGTATVLYHSVFWQYLDPATRADIAATVAAAGESASSSAPFAWLRMEANPADLAAPLDLTLTLWPGAGETLLARLHPHGAKVLWMGD
jgi:hypothetical protein